LADLRHAKLNDAYLSAASLIGAKLNVADLSDADLTDAELGGATLIGAKLNDANLSGADLTGANLSDADLHEVVLSKARIGGATLTNAYYARYGELDPDVGGIVGLSTLKEITDLEGLSGLIQLKNALQNAGLRDDERQVTNIIQRSITAYRLASPKSLLEGVLRFVGFDFTTAYGLYPARALEEIAGFWLLFILVYMQPVFRGTKEPWKPSGIYRVVPARRIDEAPSTRSVDKERLRARTSLGAFGWAAYFSLISAVNIGFQQFTPGDWIRRLQRREYTLEAVGWVRVVAGIQALLSVYLLAMWALTQFGRPFD
jgi:hypothetical protein